MRPSEVINTICSELEVTQAAICGSTRSSYIVQARHIAAWQLQHQLGMSHNEIAAILKRTPSAITHALHGVKERKARDPRFDRKLNKITQIFLQDEIQGEKAASEGINLSREGV